MPLPPTGGHWAHRASWRSRPQPARLAAPSPPSEPKARPARRREADTTFPLLSQVLAVEVLEAGSGEGAARTPEAGDTCKIHYACLVARTGCCVDSSRSKACSDRDPFVVRLGMGQVVPGMELGLKSLTLGSLARLHVPPNLGYGAERAGPIPPDSHLVFEVELLSINERRATPRRSWLLRRQLMLPPLPGLVDAAAAAAAKGRARKLLSHSAEAVQRTHAAAAEDERAAGESSPDEEAAAASRASPPAPEGGVGAANGHGALPAGGGATAGGGPHAEQASVLPAWLTRLRSLLPLPTPEGSSYHAFAAAMRPLLRRGTPSAGSADLGPKLIPGASGIAHAPYGSKWDSSAPVVLTGDREGWPASGWGWDYWEREHGDEMVLCKQRAPIFDSDQTSDTLIVECSLREACKYARTAHLSGGAESGSSPCLYMNGWDVFDALPRLWAEGMDQLPGTIDNMTHRQYTALHQKFKLDEGEAVTRRCRSLCKLFIGAVGAITRIHQDNHEAHAWLTNIRGRKLYVLCRPGDSAKVAPERSRSRGKGTMYEGRLDPLDPLAQKRAEREGLELFATVLEPGQTIIAPSGWWHYAVSLTPTITLMCNFWDSANLNGLNDTFLETLARAYDQHRKESVASGSREPGGVLGPTTACAAAGAPTVAYEAPVKYRVCHSPWVYIREEPATEAPMLGIVRPGKVVEMGAVRDGWLRTAEPFLKGKFGWVLEDGAPMKMGVLLKPVAEDWTLDRGAAG